MKTKIHTRSLTLLLVGAMSLNSINSACAANSQTTVSEKKVSEKPENGIGKAEGRIESNQKTSEKRKQVISEAIATLRETQDALKQLDEGKNKDALASLERATGKLEIVLTREPKLALVPIDVRMTSSDLYATIDAVRNAKQQAERLLSQGQVQAARAILQNLTSEAIVSTTDLPVATYPDALKKAAKLIDENKPSEAKQILQTALDTLVVTDVVIPLPVVRAKAALVKAETLAKMSNRSEQQNKQLSDLVSAADIDIKFAAELGYGKKEDFDAFHREIDAIRMKTGSGKSGTGFFDQIKNYIESMTKNSQHTNASK